MTELLAPAGNLEKLKIALAYGADAVYFAGRAYGLRSGAENFSIPQLTEAVQLAHRQGVRAYLTVNGVLHEPEFEGLSSYLDQMAPLGFDGAICSDLGVMEKVSEQTGIPIHVSTQASVVNSYTAGLYKSFGAKRVVLGREVGLEEAARIKDKTGLEVELFAHGAMCMSYSGQCTISNYMAGRDSNRGGCVHSCRFEYQLFDQGENAGQRRLLSSKDLSGLDLLERFVELGIDSAKIEGRMKSNLYIASTLRAYKAVLSSVNQQEQPDLQYWGQELNKLPHRDYITGSLESDAGFDSIHEAASEEPALVEMAGTVIGVDEPNNRFAFWLKNRLVPGVTLELLPHQGELIRIKIEQIVDLTETPLDVAQPGRVIWLPLQPGVQEEQVGRIPSKAVQKLACAQGAGC